MSDTFTEDTVRLKLDGNEIAIVEGYEVDCGVLEVPAQFSLTAGHGGTFAALAAAFPPETPFELLIGDVIVQSGETDGPATGGDAATEIRIVGSDYLRRLVDAEIESDRKFSEKTFLELARIALDDVGLQDRKIVANNTANRKAITGIKGATEFAPAAEEAERDLGLPTDATTGRVQYRSILAKVGTTWFDFLNAQNRRAGLFFWATHDGNFALATPDGHQAARYRIIRKGLDSPSSVVGRPTFSHNTRHRYSECRVYGRGGGGKHGRGKVLGFFIDQEMVALLNPNPADRSDGGKRKKLKIIHDAHVETKEQAEFLARRRIAESRRAGWRLSYTVPGHTVPALNGGGRAVWAPDTVVEVIDDELGIEGPMYVESVKFKRTPDTTTELHLMRIEDLQFAEEAPAPKLKKKMGVTSTDRFDVSLNPVFWTSDPNQIARASSLIRSTKFTTDPITWNSRGVTGTAQPKGFLPIK